MAVSATFGYPEQQQSEVTDDESVPWLKVLVVAVVSGGFSRPQAVAVAYTTTELKEYLQVWVQQNRQQYGGQYRIETVPFVSDLNEDEE